MRKLMTDGQAIAIARRIDKLRFKETALIEQLREGHQKGECIARKLQNQPIPAWATHVIHGCLLDPYSWECGEYGIRPLRGKIN